MLSGLPKAWIVLLVSALPLIELRGAIPVGMLVLGLPPTETFILAIIGNILPIPLILLLLNPLRSLAADWPLIGPFLRWAERRAMKHRPAIERHGFWGLVSFVGVPLPGTGAWTGALIAVLLQMDARRSLLACSLGVILAGILIALLSSAGLMVLS